MLKVIGPYGKKNFYNIGSNNIISNEEIVEKLVKLTNCNYIPNKNLKTTFEPKIDISDIIKEFNYSPINKSVWLEKTLINLSK